MSITEHLKQFEKTLETDFLPQIESAFNPADWIYDTDTKTFAYRKNLLLSLKETESGFQLCHADKPIGVPIPPPSLENVDKISSIALQREEDELMNEIAQALEILRAKNETHTPSTNSNPTA